MKRLDRISLAPVTKIGTMIPGKNIKVLSEDGSIIEIEQLKLQTLLMSENN